jgi:hypothetical protein
MQVLGGVKGRTVGEAASPQYVNLWYWITET